MLPEPSGVLSSLDVDVDGDGVQDVVTTYAFDRSRQTSRIRVELSDGSAVDQVAPQDYTGPPELVGATDVNDDGTPELWINPNDGNTAHTLAILIFDDCAVVEVVDADQGWLRLRYEASGNSAIGLTVGIACTDVDGDGSVDIVETQHREHVPGFRPPIEESWRYIAHSFDGLRTRVRVEEDGASLNDRPENLDWSAGLNCDGLAYGSRSVGTS